MKKEYCLTQTEDVLDIIAEKYEKAFIIKSAIDYLISIGFTPAEYKEAYEKK